MLSQPNYQFKTLHSLLLIADAPKRFKTFSSAPAVQLIMALTVVLALLALPVVAAVSWFLEHSILSTFAFGWGTLVAGLVLPLCTCVCAVLVFVSRNPIHSLLALLGVFFTTVLIYLSCGIVFVGIVFLIVYVGAVAVLFLFVIMLLNVKSLTSKDLLVTHLTQYASMFGMFGLLVQIIFITAAAVDYFLLGNFLRDAVIEPTTGAAVLFYVRFQAVDINALIGLYTSHGLLFMVITCVLLVALLGAIILATVTTERATTVSDIRAFPSPIHSAAGGLCLLSTDTELLQLIIISPPLSLILLWVDYLSKNPDFLLFVIVYRLSARDKHYFHLNRERRDGLRWRREVRDKKNNPVWARPTRFRNRFRARFLKFQLGDKLRNRITTRDAVHFSFPIFLSFAAHALAPVLLPLRHRRRPGVMVRRRWLWRWRSVRASWLYRSFRKYRLYPVLSEKSRSIPWKRRWRVRGDPRYRRRGKIKTHRTRPGWIQKNVRPPVRIRNLGVKRYIHYLLAVWVFPLLNYYLWRLRTFCVAFLIFLVFVPPIFAFLFVILEEPYIIWEAAKESHYLAERFFFGLVSVPRPYSSYAAIFFILPELFLYIFCTKFFSILCVCLLLAVHIVGTHSGELRHFTAHLSFCHSSRREAVLIYEYDERIQWETNRPRRERHPDRGRVDCTPLLSVLPESSRTSQVSIPEKAVDLIHAVGALLQDCYLTIKYRPNILVFIDRIVHPAVIFAFATVIALAVILYSLASLGLIATWRTAYLQAVRRPSAKFHFFMISLTIYLYAVILNDKNPIFTFNKHFWGWWSSNAISQGTRDFIILFGLFLAIWGCFWWVLYGFTIRRRRRRRTRERITVDRTYYNRSLAEQTEFPQLDSLYVRALPNKSDNEFFVSVRNRRGEVKSKRLRTVSGAYARAYMVRPKKIFTLYDPHPNEDYSTEKHPGVNAWTVSPRSKNYFVNK